MKCDVTRLDRIGVGERGENREGDHARSDEHHGHREGHAAEKPRKESRRQGRKAESGEEGADPIELDHRLTLDAGHITGDRREGARRGVTE